MKFSITTLGCKVNSCESAAIANAFISCGYEPAEENEPADVYIINSCAVTGTAAKKARQAAAHCRSLNPEGIIILCGCYPQAYPDEAVQMTVADIITGNAEKYALPQLAEMFRHNKRRITSVTALPRSFDERCSAPDLDRTRAFIKIEDGCDRFCTYCIIPTARGRVRSLPPEEITLLASHAALCGNREIVLTGINLGCYGEDIGYTPADAVKAAEVDGIERVRLSSLEADTLTDEEINRLKRCKKLCPHFHLSLQSGSNSVLKRMKRRYTTEDYLALTEKLRNAFPDCTFTTDIIVGFPEETDEEFAETLDFAEKAGFAKIHVFPYSIRKGTVAAMRDNQILPHIKSERVKILTALAAELEQKFLKEQIGKEFTLLIEKRSSPDYCNGFTDSYIPVRIYGEDIPRHSLVKVKITDSGENYCIGELVKGD